MSTKRVFSFSLLSSALLAAGMSASTHAVTLQITDASGNLVTCTTSSITTTDANVRFTTSDCSVSAGDGPPPVGDTGINVTNLSGSSTTEAGGSVTFSMSLKTLPQANVTIGLSSSDTTEGTVSPSSLTFTPTNGTSSQTVTVTGVDDSTADGNQTYSIVTAAATSADGDYNGVNAANVTLTNIDNDTVPSGDVDTTDCALDSVHRTDPVCDTWEPADAPFVAFQPARRDTRNYLPGCIDNPDLPAYLCSATGSMVTDETYSMRLLFAGFPSLDGVPSSIEKGSTLGIGSDSSGVYAVIATEPGTRVPMDMQAGDISTYADLDQSSCALTISNGGEVKIADSSTFANYRYYIYMKDSTCQLDPDNVYYLNVWPADEKCTASNTSYDCRTELIIGSDLVEAMEMYPDATGLMPNEY